MTLSSRERSRGRIAALIFAGVGLLALGAWGGAVWTERRAETTPRTPAAALPASSDAPRTSVSASDEPVEVTLTPEAIARAGIRTAVVQESAITSTVTGPGTVASNAYRDTKVSALVGGVVGQVPVELGSAVRRGQQLAIISSPDLADAQMKYLSMRATLEADHQKRLRTEKLFALGAVSRQELEDVVAVHAAHETEVAAARQRLLVFGLSAERVSQLQHASQVVSEVTVPSPADGVVITRTVNPGQVVTPGQELFAVTDLSTVWIIGDLYEKDFAAVRVDSEAVVRIGDAQGSGLRGRVAYIDPRIDTSTRTAKVRVEVPNRAGELRLGMFVSVVFASSTGRRAIVVPRTAVQSIGERTVVYVDEGDGRFGERSVQVHSMNGNAVHITEGLRPGEYVVTEGSFLVRAEATRTRSGP